MMTSAYTLEHISFQYPSNDLLAINDLSVDIHKGKTTALLGPNGAGKSTLMDILLSYRAPSKGNLSLFGKPIQNYTKKDLGKNVALVPQDERSRFAFSVIEYVLFGRSPYIDYMKSPGQQDIEIAYKSLDLVGLSSLAHRQSTTLSGGEHQLLLLARVLAQQPKVILLDEPTSSLDPSNTARVLDILSSLKNKGITLLLTTHDPSIAADIADEVVMIKKGKLLFSGSIEEGCTSELLTNLYETPLHTFTYQDKLIITR
jgi:iron complex transport system ATP-binding protein